MRVAERFERASGSGKPLLLDGATGSYLQQSGVVASDAMWSARANVEAPETVLAVHRAYLEAGADAITANTFRTNPLALRGAGREYDDAAERAIALAREAVRGTDALVAGSNPPAEDCYQRERRVSRAELERNHREHLERLAPRCDFLLLETQSRWDEIEIQLEWCAKGGAPFVVSFYVGADGRLLSGECVGEAARRALDYGPLAIGVNCVSLDTYANVERELPNEAPTSAHLNCGDGAVTDETISCGVSPKEYAAFWKSGARRRPTLLGACCGSEPAHIKALRKAIDETY